MNRHFFYIDGFNVYHTLNDNPSYRKYKWLDYSKLAKSVVGAYDKVESLFYFTAFAIWKPYSVTFRHKQYIKALRSVGVEAIHGRFMKKYTKCHRCNQYFLTHEEKRTDVNIALKLLCDALDNRYDRAIIISADSDLIPVIKAVHKYAPDKEIGVMFPIGRTSSDLRREADFRRRMPERLLKDCQFPDEFKVKGKVVKRPDTWQ